MVCSACSTIPTTARKRMYCRSASIHSNTDGCVLMLQNSTERHPSKMKTFRKARVIFFPAGKLYFLALYQLKDTDVLWDLGNDFWGSGIRHQI